MKGKAAYRGQPLLMLVFLLGSWVTLRAATWEQPFGHFAPRPVRKNTEETEPAYWRVAGPMSVPSGLPVYSALSRFGEAAIATADRWVGGGAPSAAARRTRMGGFVAADPRDPISLLPPDAGYAEPTSGNVAAAPAAIPLQPLAPAPPPTGSRRWSADAWLLLRRGDTPSAASGSSSYGASQFGAVLRYRLALSDPHRPTAYLRTTGALTASKEAEAAAGFAARPFAGIPVSVAAELRALRVGGLTAVRPAAYAVTELAPFKLPLAFTGEAYAQAGYVGGDFATPFIDGQLRAERPFAHLGPAKMRAGAGAWGGAQKGASRIDVGPAATLGLQIGRVPSRLSLDWRFRIAGNAEPSDGPALTLSAGF